ncbi:hypothetical protein EG68_04594 [Paragonimus skrjabini miyazakii]|uniref:Cytochrome P450 n=1 Tax=Paragonimus skrjabini miyazakii TaxID=59628 RepID=A0A8S9YTU6_9TREM|nr:hypothetical protein EG68_04594 [Paragonimus skrjabini miyazakii]
MMSVVGGSQMEVLYQVAVSPFCKAFCGLAFCYGSYYLFNRYLGKSSLPPGPRGLPWIGYTPCLGTAALDELASLHKQYGDVVSFKALGNTIVVLNSYQAIQEAAVLNRHKVGRCTLTVNHWLAKGHGISNYDTPRALNLRRALFRHLYGQEEVIDYLTDKNTGCELTRTIKQEIGHLLKTLEETQGTPVLVAPLMRLTAWRIMWRLVFGSTCNMDAEEIIYILQQISSNNMENGVLRISQQLPKCLLHVVDCVKSIQRLLGMDKLAARYDSVCRILNRELDRSDQSAYRPGSLLHRFQKDEKLQVEKEELGRLTFELMAAGTDTSSMTLTWACAYMAENPSHFQEVVGDIQMNNIHRYASVVPLGLPHVARESMTILGYYVPAGATILFNLQAVHEAQMDDREGSATTAIPFSIGSRDCPGSRFANKLLKDIVSAISDRFSVETTDNNIRNQRNADNPDRKSRVSKGLTRGPADGLYIFKVKSD